MTLFASIPSSTVHPTKTKKNNTHTRFRKTCYVHFFASCNFVVGSCQRYLPCNGWRNGIPSRCHEACIQKVLNQCLEGQQQKKQLAITEDVDMKTSPMHHQNGAAAQVFICNYNPNWKPYFRWEEKMMCQCLVGESCFIKSWGEIGLKHVNSLTTWNDLLSDVAIVAYRAT